MLSDLARNSQLTSSVGSELVTKLLTFATIRYQATFLYRLSARAGRISGLLGLTVKQLNQLITGADIAWQARIDSGLVLFHPSGVVIGPDVVIGRDCDIQQGVTLGSSGRYGHGSADSPTIGHGVKVGAGARVIGAIVIGDSVTVGANSVVLRDVPSNSVVVGVPARIVGKP